MIADPVDIALQQIGAVKSECAALLDSIKTFSLPDERGVYPDTFRLIATPMLYSVWERCFTICHAVALRLIRDVTTATRDLTPPMRSIWLLKTPFYRKLLDRSRNGGYSSEECELRGKIRKGDFSVLCDFIPELDNWLANGLDTALNTDKLVMTFSNVNPEVVEVNARAIGIDSFDEFKMLKFGLLHDLVGQRNDIGHGAIIEPPTNERFLALFQFTEKLIIDYCNVFIAWIRKQSQ